MVHPYNYSFPSEKAPGVYREVGYLILLSVAHLLAYWSGMLTVLCAGCIFSVTGINNYYLPFDLLFSMVVLRLKKKIKF